MESKRVGEGLLPPGWVAVTDKTLQRKYYYHPESKTSTWKRPRSTDPSSSIWKCVFSKEHNRVYYFNKLTKETSWENPSLTAKPIPNNEQHWEKELTSAIELIASLQLSREKLESELQLALHQQKTAPAESSELTLKWNQSQITIKNLEKRNQELQRELESVKQNAKEAEQEFVSQLEAKNAIEQLLRDEIEDLQAQLQSSSKSEASCVQVNKEIDQSVQDNTFDSEVAGDVNPQVRPLLEAPKDLAIRYSILDRYKNYRGCITQDGTAMDNFGSILGHINFQTLEAGSRDELFLGHVYESSFDNVSQIRNDADELEAYLDLGTRSIKSPNGSTVVDFQVDGVLKHPNGTFLGQFVGAKGFHDMREITLFLVLLDPGMCSDVKG